MFRMAMVFLLVFASHATAQDNTPQKPKTPQIDLTRLKAHLKDGPTTKLKKTDTYAARAAEVDQLHAMTQTGLNQDTWSKRVSLQIMATEPSKAELDEWKKLLNRDVGDLVEPGLTVDRIEHQLLDPVDRVAYGIGIREQKKYEEFSKPFRDLEALDLKIDANKKKYAEGVAKILEDKRIDPYTRLPQRLFTHGLEQGVVFVDVLGPGTKVWYVAKKDPKKGEEKGMFHIQYAKGMYSRDGKPLTEDLTLTSESSPEYTVYFGKDHEHQQYTWHCGGSVRYNEEKKTANVYRRVSNGIYEDVKLMYQK